MSADIAPVDKDNLLCQQQSNHELKFSVPYSHNPGLNLQPVHRQPLAESAGH
ncbi:MAG: hypothetical protein NTY50_04470 [Methylobacter sp.]|nr:hypothetical protein [Methylobacter sp.]